MLSDLLSVASHKCSHLMEVTSNFQIQNYQFLDLFHLPSLETFLYHLNLKYVSNLLEYWGLDSVEVPI